MQHISSSYLRIKGILSKHSHSDKQEWFLFQSHLWKTHLGSSRMRSYSLNFQNKELKNRKLAAYLAFLYCESACNAGDPGSIPGLGRSAGEGIATHSSILGFPCGSTGNRIRQQCERPGFNPWFGKTPWKRERLPTPVFWAGEFHGLYRPWGHKESDTTERLSLHFTTSATFER